MIGSSDGDCVRAPGWRALAYGDSLPCSEDSRAAHDEIGRGFLMPSRVLDLLAKVPSTRLMIGSDLPENLPVELVKVLWLDAPADDKQNMPAATASALFLGAG